MYSTIIAYASIIIGAVAMALTTKFKPKNRIIRFILKLLISAAIPTAIVFGYLAGKDSGGVFIRTVIALFEMLALGTLCFYAIFPRDTYVSIYELVEFVFDDRCKWWKPWVGHVSIAFVFAVFLFCLVSALINLPLAYGYVTIIAVLTLISVVIIILFCFILYLLYTIVSDWIKWMFE